MSSDETKLGSLGLRPTLSSASPGQGQDAAVDKVPEARLIERVEVQANFVFYVPIRQRVSVSTQDPIAQ